MLSGARHRITGSIGQRSTPTESTVAIVIRICADLRHAARDQHQPGGKGQADRRRRDPVENGVRHRAAGDPGITRGQRHHDHQRSRQQPHHRRQRAQPAAQPLPDLDRQIDPGRARHQPAEPDIDQKRLIVDPVPALHKGAVQPGRGAAAKAGHAEPEERRENRRQTYPRRAVRLSLSDLGHSTLPPDRPSSEVISLPDTGRAALRWPIDHCRTGCDALARKPR